MPIATEDDIFSDGLSSNGSCSASAVFRIQGKSVLDTTLPSYSEPQIIANNTEETSADLQTTDEVTDAPRRKDGRVMSDKSVGTSEDRSKKRPRITTIRDIETENRREAKSDIEGTSRSLVPRSSGTSLNSQYSFWGGDEELDAILDDLDMKDEQEVENLPDTQPLTEDLSMSISGRSDSGSSGASSTATSSTEATSVYSEASVFPDKLSLRSRNGGKDEQGCTKFSCRVVCSPATKPSLEVSCSVTPATTFIDEQHVVVDSPVSVRSAVCHEKVAHPRARPIRKSAEHTGDKKTPQPEVIDLTGSDDEAPDPSEASLQKPSTNKQVTLNGALVNEEGHDLSPNLAVNKAAADPISPRNAALVPAEMAKELRPFVIAHDSKAQALLDKHAISRGIQFEIARGISQGWWDWNCILDEKAEKLKGLNSEKAPSVARVISPGKPEVALTPFVLASRMATYAELDREHEALLERQSRGLGLKGAWHGVESWYGGRVQQVARLSEFNERTGDMKITLDRLEMGRSNRLTRFLGSVSVLQIRIKKALVTRHGNALIKILARRFILCGRIFLPFHAKENKVYLVEINEDFERSPVPSLGDDTRHSWDEFIKWHNPLELNAKQPISKWSTRWALTLSTSTPVLEFAPENIHFIPDIYAEGQQECTESMMTDGCGFMNLSALLTIATVMKVFSFAVQGRIAGSKGVWLLHPDACHRDREEPPMIWIRESQYKINLGPPQTWDRSHLIFDLVRLHRLTIPSSLYMQTIVNMSFNGVKDSVFSKLLEDGLRREIDPLVAWNGQHASARLAKAVENAGGLMGSRLGRLVGAEARVYNYIRDENKNADFDTSDEEEENKGLIERHSSSGFPISLYESTRELLQAGFHPLTSSIVREKLKNIVKIVMEQYMEQYHITVPYSAEAFIVPDPYGVLEEGQIYFRSSKPILDPTTSADPHTFSGPVLITRNPTRVASDVQKVTAVAHDKLLSYTDVIIFPIKGKRSLASYLGGGDYDGDTVTIIGDPAIVDGFRCPPTIQEPSNLRDYFEREVEEVKAFVLRTSESPGLERERELCMKLLLGLSDSKVGLYSQFHDNALYRIGYNHPETVRLAYMFTTCLDSSKTGLRLKSDVFKHDSLKWNRPRPECMQKALERQQNHNSGSNMNPFTRSEDLGKFVLDALKNSASELRKDVLIRYEDICKEAETKKDMDIARAYREAEELTLRFKTEYNICEFWDQFSLMKVEVSKLCDEYISKVGEYFRNSPRKPRLGQATLTYDIPVSSPTSRQEIIRKLAERFNNINSGLFAGSHFKEIKASYAYVYACDKRHDGLLAREFPFSMAHDALCAIKARKDGAVTITQESADLLTVSGKLLQVPVRD